ncbi:Flp family type IVb pilin [uncultured Arthrobacter sp.]|uniref:Flp family type IVb pilin n=1 Tax=uncultured Arthrobacter sp. TaxID=114050 RepID=UPI002606CB7B|nr:Flp family type IVb pilin [uncultured Arthrobacter sp.]
MLSHFVAFTNTIKARMNRDETGATAVEYGIMVALIAVAIIAGVILLGDQLEVAFESITGGLTEGGIVVPE